MHKGRLEAFSDGVIAIIITIMVLEMRAPETVDINALWQLLPIFLSYVLSYMYLGIYWNNHHHLFQAVKRVNGRVLWANLHLLFWLSLIPFVTRWMGKNYLSPLAVALYGVVLLCAGTAYYILVHVLLSKHGKDSLLVKAIGSDFKGKISVAIYFIAVLLTLFNTWIALALYFFVAILWLIPDRRIEKIIDENN